MTRAPTDAQGIQSIEIGGRLLAALAESGGPASLSALAAAADMPASKARRYLLSLSRVGLVAQRADTGLYTVGPMAMRLGLVAQRDLDVLREGGRVVADLAAQLNQTVALIVWSDRGPVVVRFVASQHNVAIFVRVGSVVPLLTSAAGRLFLAHLPDSATADLVAAELTVTPTKAKASNPWRDDRERRRLLDDLRAAGFAWVEGAIVPGIVAVAAPAFDASGAMAAAIVTYGPEGTLSVAPGGDTVASLKAAAASLSARLGHDPDAL